jgi:D-arabinose 1-dehydrogenase-like Zn-dependent alcohol dehydrogenase
LKRKKLSLQDFPVTETLGPYDVKIQIKACGVCGSDVHYYLEGAIGDFIVREPMILGYEAAGIIIEKGKQGGVNARAALSQIPQNAKVVVLNGPAHSGR